MVHTGEEVALEGAKLRFFFCFFFKGYVFKKKPEVDGGRWFAQMTERLDFWEELK